MYRNILLLIASYYFYMCWRPEFALLILLTSAMDYYLGIRIGASPFSKTKRGFLILSIVGNLGILFFFKYLNFFSESLKSSLDYFNLSHNLPALNIILPVGISFFTFQKLSYIIDVYLEKRPPEKSAVVFALYVAFFPQLVAGPIERSTRLLPQFHIKSNFSYSRLVKGTTLIIWGFFMKLVIADNLGIYVDNIYNNPYEYSGGHFIIATYFFAFQIFGDFAGYSSIAIGTACLFGFDLMTNFRRPYFAKDIRAFWLRWHISLSTWFRDYLYIPLGGNRKGQWRNTFNLVVVFLVSGLWHGANWTFVIWGAIHAFFILAYKYGHQVMARLIPNLEKINSYKFTGLVLITLNFNLVCLAWIFFRANNLDEAMFIVGNLFSFPSIDVSYVASLVLPFSGDYSSLALFISVIGFILILEGVHWIQESKSQFVLNLWNNSSWFKGGCLTSAVLMILFFGNFGSKSFIYFQF